MAEGLPRPQPGSWGSAWLPHGSQPTGSGGHSSGCSEAGAATGSRKRNLLRSRPGRALPLSHRSARQPGPARCGRVCAVVCAIGAWGRWPLYPVLWGGGSGARPCTPHGNRAAALSPGPSGARRDSWVRGRSAPLECFRGRRPGSRPFQSDLCNFTSNLKQVRRVLGHIQVLPQPQGLRGGEGPPRACPAALLVCRGRGQAPAQELVAVLTLGLQHWEAPHPAWASSGPWGGSRRQEALEPPALLYLDIPEPRSSAWPAAAPERAATEGQGQESQTGNLPEGTDAGPSVVSCQVTGTSGPRAAQRPEGLPGSPRPELPSRPRGAGPRMGARGVPGACARRHSTETAHGRHPTCRLPGGRERQSHEAEGRPSSR